MANKNSSGTGHKQLGFYFDQSLCNGCKACQIACKDKHDTPLGTNWRRVVEYSGGDWNLADGVFNHDTFTYYTSMACNHCEDPICAQVCPTTAMSKGEDGIVTVDPAKCIGCRYCEWACPYSAPQFNPETKQMSKCDMCADLRAEGEEPACATACPSRALDWGPIDELREKYGNVNAVAPLPDPSITKPNLVIRPHRDAKEWDTNHGEIMNRQEI